MNKERLAVILGFGLHLAAIGLAVLSIYLALFTANPAMTSFDRSFGAGIGVACLLLALSVVLTMDRWSVAAAALLIPFAFLAGGFAAPSLAAVVLGWVTTATVRRELRLQVPAAVLRYKSPIRFTGRLVGAASVVAVSVIIVGAVVATPDPQFQIRIDQNQPAGQSIRYRI